MKGRTRREERESNGAKVKKTGKEKLRTRTSLGVRRLSLCTFKARGTGSVPGRETKVSHAIRCSQENKKIWPPKIKRKMFKAENTAC